MSICLSPGEAAPRIGRLLAGLKRSWVDLAVQQDATALADCPSLRAWLDGDRTESTRLMLGPGHLAGTRDFTTASRRNADAGVSLVRIHLVDEERQRRDSRCRGYLGWLRELFRQINIPWGGETVHWLPVSACERAGIALPRDDVAIFDDRMVLTSRYDAGQLISRTFHDSGEDQATLDWARA
ncbi:MAG: DUF6879 family protein, partial [Trebonia sp.]